MVHLRLTELYLGPQGHPLQTIQYVFGKIPREAGMLDLGGRSSAYVVVQEQVRRLPDRGPGLHFVQLGTERFYWEYAGNFRSRDASLAVRSNQSGALVRRIARSILAAEGCAR